MGTLQCFLRNTAALLAGLRALCHQLKLLDAFLRVLIACEQVLQLVVLHTNQFLTVFKLGSRGHRPLFFFLPAGTLFKFVYFESIFLDCCAGDVFVEGGGLEKVGYGPAWHRHCVV